jgi:hypothetical protein
MRTIPLVTMAFLPATFVSVSDKSQAQGSIATNHFPDHFQHELFQFLTKQSI